MGTYVFRLQTLHLLVHKRHSCLETNIKKNTGNVRIVFEQPILQTIAIRNTYSRFVHVALGMQHAVRIDHIFIYGLSAILYFPYYHINGRFFEKKLLNIKRVE